MKKIKFLKNILAKINLRNDFIPYILLVLVTLFLFRYLLTLPSHAFIGDIHRYNAYQTLIIQYSLENFHQFAFWDQFLAAGISWISNPAGPHFFVTSWILILLSHDIFFVGRMLLLIHIVTAALSFYFLCRVLGLQKSTGFFISIVYICTQYAGTFILNGWFEEFLGLTLIPLTVALLILSFRKQNYFYAILAAIVMANHFFADTFYVVHYHMIIIAWITLVYFVKTIFTIYQQKKETKDNLLKFIYLNIVFWGVFVGLSAVKLLPILEFREISARSILPLSLIETPDGVMSFTSIA